MADDRTCKLIYFASFQIDGRNYLAAGVDHYYLAVFFEIEHIPRHYARHGEIRWPSWLKFLSSDTIVNYKEGSVADLDALERDYGIIASSKIGAIFSEGPDEIVQFPERYVSRLEAMRLWEKSGDPTMAIDLGLLPPWD